MQLSIYQLQILKNYFATQPVLRAYLFGSYAWAMATPESDIDILVELDYEQLIGLEFVQMHLDLQNIFNKKVDLISANGLSKYLIQTVNQEKNLFMQDRLGDKVRLMHIIDALNEVDTYTIWKILQNNIPEFKQQVANILKEKF